VGDVAVAAVTVTYVSLFSGAGGWDLGCDAAGWECVAQVEWDRHCRSVLERHWPDVPKWGDIATVHGSDLPPADVVCFGSPCTDLSVAGRRAGLHGEDSGLFFEATRIIEEMRHATRNAFPRAVIFENVYGALSSNQGRDFARVLDELANLGAVAVEWRVVDGLAFGPPQRRTRVFVVAVLDPRTDSGRPIFAEREGVRRNPAPRRQAGERVGALTANCVGGGGGPDDNAAQAGHLIAFNGFNGMDAQVSATHTPVIKGDAGGASVPQVLTDVAVRRLTPRECEALQGWPRDHTALTADGSRIADSQRYRMCGNGVMAPMGEWVARRVTEALA
jgi:DNA (cytosine-5)-methyltransferase 1